VTKLWAGRAIAQAISCWLPTMAARVWSRVWSCVIFGGQSGAGAGFLRVLRFPLPIFIPPIAPHSPSPIIWGWYYRPEVAAVQGTWSYPTINKKKSYGLDSQGIGVQFLGGWEISLVSIGTIRALGLTHSCIQWVTRGFFPRDKWWTWHLLTVLRLRMWELCLHFHTYLHAAVLNSLVARTT
jgi:hypothetical protein